MSYNIWAGIMFTFGEGEIQTLKLLSKKLYKHLQQGMVQGFTGSIQWETSFGVWLRHCLWFQESFPGWREHSGLRAHSTTSRPEQWQEQACKQTLERKQTQAVPSMARCIPQNKKINTYINGTTTFTSYLLLARYSLRVQSSKTIYKAFNVFSITKSFLEIISDFNVFKARNSENNCVPRLPRRKLIFSFTQRPVAWMGEEEIHSTVFLVLEVPMPASGALLLL